MKILLSPSVNNLGYTYVPCRMVLRVLFILSPRKLASTWNDPNATGEDPYPLIQSIMGWFGHTGMVFNEPWKE